MNNALLILGMYTIDKVVDVDNKTTITVNGGIQPHDQRRLELLGWERVNDTTFVYEKPKLNMEIEFNMGIKKEDETNVTPSDEQVNE